MTSKQIILVTLALIVGMAGLASLGPEPQRAAQPPEERPDRAADARWACRAFIEQTLNDPGSAEWVAEDRWATSGPEQGPWQVRAVLRARNGFGALMLGEFDCEVELVGSNWRLLALDQVSP